MYVRLEGQEVESQADVVVKMALVHNHVIWPVVEWVGNSWAINRMANKGIIYCHVLERRRD